MDSKYRCIVIGVSAGGMDALSRLLGALPAGFVIPIIVVQHLSADADDHFRAQCFDERLDLVTKLTEDKETIRAGHIYLAPADYHVHIEDDLSLSLCTDHKVLFARPSIDVLFESAAFAIGKHLIGIVLTGANSDGAIGLQSIEKSGGLVIVQDPLDAHSSAMPHAAIRACKTPVILPLDDIAEYLMKICEPQSTEKNG